MDSGRKWIKLDNGVLQKNAPDIISTHDGWMKSTK